MSAGTSGSSGRSVPSLPGPRTRPTAHTGNCRVGQHAGVEGSLVAQLIACAAVLAYSLVMTAVVLWVTSRVTRLRVREADERTGLDLALHNESLS